MMEFNDLVIFAAVYQCGSFSKAAQILDYVQPNISNRIKKIENQLGIKLFKRTNRGISILPAADQLYAHTQKILIDYHNMLGDLSKYKTIRIGATPTLAYSVVPYFTQRLKASGYQKVLNTTHPIAELFERLNNNEVDCIWVNRKFDDSTYKSLYSFHEGLFIVSNCDWNSMSMFNSVVSQDENCPYRKQLINFLNNKSKHYNVIEFDNLGSVLNSIYTIQNCVTLLPEGLKNSFDTSLKQIFTDEYVTINLIAKKGTAMTLAPT